VGNRSEKGVKQQPHKEKRKNIGGGEKGKEKSGRGRGNPHERNQATSQTCCFTGKGGSTLYYRGGEGGARTKKFQTKTQGVSWSVTKKTVGGQKKCGGGTKPSDGNSFLISYSVGRGKGFKQRKNGIRGMK